MNPIILLGAGGLAYFALKEKKVTQTVEDLKKDFEVQLSNVTSYYDTKLDELEKKDQVSTYLQPTACNINLRSINSKGWNIQVKVYIKNTLKTPLSITNLDVRTAIAGFNLLGYFVNTGTYTIGPGEVKEIIVYSADNKTLADNASRDGIRNALAVANGMQSWGAASQAKCAERRMAASAICNIGFTVSSTVAQAAEPVKFQQVGGKCTVMGIGGTYLINGKKVGDFIPF